MEIKLFDSELKIMEILWKEGSVTAKHIADVLGKQVGWSKTTTYTVIKKCLDKGAVLRIDPDFVCRALITREQAQQFETTELINKMYDGAADQLIASLLGRKKLSSKEIERLKQLVNELE
ncbi:BlaI/MecI/CopY family transcriptional regulator [Cohnella endophytica]|uniref:BlaI/MecI/CopY family transcriptional regulator n=1 Tax=Cohnella endophytica TaxID=2419778 RepID=A0A494XH06_9BACL|nr:BlaI/MecI/CopY family transcriptional regulator [Cohnella endophytica]RKP47886.1 BlaI/MecI/CopY family transcriptional regulator [Cohnella endophytica]